MRARTVQGAFLAHLVTFGTAYGFGVLSVPVTRELGLSAWEYSLVGGLATTLYLALSGVTGRLADRVGATRLMVAGALAVGAGLAVTALATSLPVLLLGYVLLFGTGVSLAFVPSLAAVAHTRPARPSRAAGLAAAGAGVGTLLVGPGAALLIDAVGWRPTVWLLAGGAVVLLLVAAALVGEVHGVPAVAAAPVDPRPPGRRLVLLGMVLVGFGYYVPFVQLVPSLVAGGRTLAGASTSLLVLGAASVAGRVALGGIGDRGRPQVWLTSSVAGMAAGCLLLAAGPPAVVLAGVAVFGAAAGAFVAFVPSVAAHLAGPGRAGTQTGLFYTGLAGGAALGPVAAGSVAGTGAGYPGAFAAAAGVLLLGAVACGAAVRRVGRPAPSAARAHPVGGAPH